MLVSYEPIMDGWMASSVPFVQEVAVLTLFLRPPKSPRACPPLQGSWSGELECVPRSHPLLCKPVHKKKLCELTPIEKMDIFQGPLTLSTNRQTFLTILALDSSTESWSSNPDSPPTLALSAMLFRQ